MEKPVQYRKKSIQPLRRRKKRSASAASPLMEPLWGAADLTGEEEAAWEKGLAASDDPDSRAAAVAMGFLPPAGGWVDD